MDAMNGLTGLTSATEFIDSDSERVRDYANRAVGPSISCQRAAAVAAFYAVRDKLHYDVYGADFSREGLRASRTIERGSGLCIHKSIVYAAVMRSLGIPSRLVFADVRNHIASPQLRKFVGGDIFHFHCMAAVRLEGRWLRVTPVFSRSVCRLFGIQPLEFDGTQDSIFQPCEGAAGTHMEFVREHGEFDDLPYERVVNGLRGAHPGLFAGPLRFRGGAMETDLASHAADPRRPVEDRPAVDPRVSHAGDETW